MDDHLVWQPFHNKKKRESLINHEKYTEILQWHNGIEYFDYNPAIDWAIELIRNGNESDNILIVASFSKPVDREEIKPYITGALKELNLNEKYGEYSIIANVHYYLEQILNDYEMRKNLSKLYEICLYTNMDSRLMPFYFLYHGWCELEEIGENDYFEGADLDNIEEVIKDQAKICIDQYVFGKESLDKIEEKEVLLKSYNLKEEIKIKAIWQSIKSIWNKK
ncbi:MAG: hypothetical protein IPO94_03490 [Saprospiraceae bacterium]|nr:hypothetical protein [Saprospiraceae bacterium]